MARFHNQKAAFTTKKRPDIIRKLDRFERLQSAQHQLELYCGCAISCRYVVPDALPASGPAGLSLKNIVENAFALAILKHPLFTVGLINEDSKRPSWVRLDHIDLHNHIEWQTVTESENYEEVLQDVLEWQVNHYFTHLETRPHWRSVILRPTNFNFVDVVFAWGHTTGDGKSGKLFHDSLLACLNSQSGGADTRPLENRSFEVPVTAFTPPLDRLLEFPMSWDFVLSEAWRTLNASSKAPNSPYAATWAPVQRKPCTTRLSLITVEKDALPRVLEACRQHKSTLTGLVHALVLVSMATRLPKDKARAFESGTPVCLRRFYRSGPSVYSSLDMENTVTNSVTYWPYKFEEDIVAKIRQQVNDAKGRPESNVDLEVTVWSVATTLRQELSKKLKLGTKNDITGLMKFVRDWRSYLKDQVKTRAYSWEISNLGVINGEVPKENESSGEGEKWTIERATFTQSAPVSGPALTISQIAVKGRTLTMTCSWQIEVVDDELAQGLSSDLETWLNGLGKTGSISFN